MLSPRRGPLGVAFLMVGALVARFLSWPLLSLVDGLVPCSSFVLLCLASNVSCVGDRSRLHPSAPGLLDLLVLGLHFRGPFSGPLFWACSVVAACRPCPAVAVELPRSSLSHTAHLLFWGTSVFWLAVLGPFCGFGWCLFRGSLVAGLLAR